MALPIISENVSETELDDMMDNALTASNFLKAISHEGRLMILCHLLLQMNLKKRLKNYLLILKNTINIFLSLQSRI